DLVRREQATEVGFAERQERAPDVLDADQIDPDPDALRGPTRGDALLRAWNPSTNQGRGHRITRRRPAAAVVPSGLPWATRSSAGGSLRPTKRAPCAGLPHRH